MPKQKSPPSYEFRFVTERTLRQEVVQITRNQSATLRSKLPKGLYWLQPTGRTILWNQTLLVDYLVNGDRPEHQVSVDLKVLAIESKQYLRTSRLSLIHQLNL